MKAYVLYRNGELKAVDYKNKNEEKLEKSFMKNGDVLAYWLGVVPGTAEEVAVKVEAVISGANKGVTNSTEREIRGFAGYYGVDIQKSAGCTDFYQFQAYSAICRSGCFCEGGLASGLVELAKTMGVQPKRKHNRDYVSLVECLDYEAAQHAKYAAI